MRKIFKGVKKVMNQILENANAELKHKEEMFRISIDTLEWFITSNKALLTVGLCLTGLGAGLVASAYLKVN